MQVQFYTFAEIIVIFTIISFKTDITYDFYFTKISVKYKGEKRKANFNDTKKTMRMFT